MVRLTPAAALVLAALGAAAPSPRESSPPARSRDSVARASLRPGMAAGMNLLVVTLDTTRADRLGCYGYEAAVTPFLDSFAREAIRFDDAVAVAPLTLPSHASIFTGRYPLHHGVRVNTEHRLGPDERTLAERLSAKGYETAAFVSAFVLDARFGLAQGFDRYDDSVRSGPGSVFPSGTLERPADDVTSAALAWLGTRDRRRPFFVWVHYFDPHAPYSPPPGDPRLSGRPYDGEIAFADSQFGRLRKALASEGLDGRTVVLVLGDHGESLGEHRELTHGVFVYDSVMRVPLLLKVPGASEAAGRVDERVTSQVDVLPTVLDLLGMKEPDDADRGRLDGRSLLDPPSRDRTVFLESMTSFLDYGWAPLYAARRSGVKLIQAPRPEYYDLRVDPAELRDRAAVGGRRERDELQRELAEYLAGAAPASAAPPTLPDPETRERLAALGYVGGAGPTGEGPLRDPKDMIEVSQKLIEVNVLTSQGRLREALALAQDAAGLSPGDRSVLHASAKIYLRLGRLREAEQALRAFRTIRPSCDTSLLLAQILILDGRQREASALLDEAEALDAFHGGVFIARGDLLVRQGRAEAARRSYAKARQVDPYRAAGTAAARLRALAKPKPPR